MMHEIGHISGFLNTSKINEFTEQMNPVGGRYTVISASHGVVSGRSIEIQYLHPDFSQDVGLGRKERRERQFNLIVHQDNGDLVIPSFTKIRSAANYLSENVFEMRCENINYVAAEIEANEEEPVNNDRKIAELEASLRKEFEIKQNAVYKAKGKLEWVTKNIDAATAERSIISERNLTQAKEYLDRIKHDPATFKAATDKLQLELVEAGKNVQKVALESAANPDSSKLRGKLRAANNAVVIINDKMAPEAIVADAEQKVRQAEAELAQITPEAMIREAEQELEQAEAQLITTKAEAEASRAHLRAAIGSAEQKE